MNIYVYCPRPSQGALDLMHALGGRRLRRFDGLSFWNASQRVRLDEGDVIVCWGGQAPEMDGIRVLNNGDNLNKQKELLKLQGNVACVQIITKDIATHPNCAMAYGGPGIGRMFRHSGGADLLNPPENPDFYVVQHNFVKEYRIHSFSGRSIRAGIKVVRDGFTLASDPKEWKPNSGLAHPWIRSFDAGWRVKYDEFKSTAPMRNLAHKAVNILGLTFGAVDIGQTPSGGLVVLEVNRAPGIEGESIQAYVRAITKWIDKEVPDAVEDDEKPTVVPAADWAPAPPVAELARAAARAVVDYQPFYEPAPAPRRRPVVRANPVDRDAQWLRNLVVEPRAVRVDPEQE